MKPTVGRVVNIHAPVRLRYRDRTLCGVVVGTEVGEIGIRILDPYDTSYDFIAWVADQENTENKDGVSWSWPLRDGLAAK